MNHNFDFLTDEQKSRVLNLERKHNEIKEEIALLYSIEEHNHVDTFINYGTHMFAIETPEYGLELYARVWLSLRRLSAPALFDFVPIIDQQKLFCTWNDRRMRVIGASALGDIWLTGDFKNDTSYQERVQYSECSEWNKHSKRP